MVEQERGTTFLGTTRVEMQKAVHRGRPFEEGAGDGLLSRDLSIGVPSALQVLTVVFEMGTSVAPAL